MSAIHLVVAWLVVGLFALGWIWGLGARLLRRDPGLPFWRWLAAIQVAAAVQALLGITLLLMGRRVVSAGALGGLLHYVYGILPLALFVFAHMVARAGHAGMLGFNPDKPISPWVPFAWASFISFGLTLRALMTGLGVG